MLCENFLDSKNEAVVPAKAGIQSFQTSMDSHLRGSDGIPVIPSETRNLLNFNVLRFFASLRMTSQLRMKKIPPRPPFSKGGIKGKNFKFLPPPLAKGE